MMFPTPSEIKMAERSFNDTDLFLVCLKVKNGSDACSVGRPLEDNPYVDSLARKAWRFGWKLAQVYMTDRAAVRLKSMGVHKRFQNEAEQAYKDAKAALTEDVPEKMVDMFV